MSITLQVHHAGYEWRLARANARITTSAEIAIGNQIMVGDIPFDVIAIRHLLAPTDGSIAPTTYAILDPSQGLLTDKDIQQLVAWGFK